jgi:hypothetical protein
MNTEEGQLGEIELIFLKNSTHKQGILDSKCA